MKIKDDPNIKTYLTYSIPDLTRVDLGIKSFSALENQILEIKQMIDEMISIADSNESLPRSLRNSIPTYVNRFLELVNPIIAYNIDQDNGFHKHRNSLLILMPGTDQYSGEPLRLMYILAICYLFTLR